MNSYTKLKDGTWGVKVRGSVAAGDKVTVQTKAGATKEETVAKVIWTGQGVSICSVARQTAGGEPKRGGRDVCCECGRPGKLVSDLEDGLMKHVNCCDIPPGGY